MGHYYFIQSVKIEDTLKKRSKISQDDTLVEWKYEIPPMFFPLFSSQPRYENSLLYCKGKEGFKNIKKMYNFLEKHRELAFDNPDEFLSYKKKIIDYLEESLQDYYELNGTDVFSMTYAEDDYLNKSENCYKLMQEVNSQIEEAIKNDDIEAFLSIYTDAEITHKSAQLRYFFNLNTYLYGYECILTTNKPLEYVEIFEENNKFGLKLEDRVILSPIYDEIFGFGENEIYSVIQNGDKYGYINTNGNLIIPLIYDDAYDFNVNYNWDKKSQINIKTYRAIIQNKGKYGVIDEKNNIILPSIYDDIVIYEAHAHFPFMIVLTTNNGQKTILDVDGKELYPAVITEIYYFDDKEENKYANFYGRLLIESKEDTYYLNSELKPYGYNVEIIQNGFEFYTKRNEFTYCFIAKNKEGKKGIINWHDETLLPFEFDDVEVYSPTTHNLFFKTTKNAKEALYSIQLEQEIKLVIPPIYDKLAEFIYIDVHSIYSTIEKNNKKGVYSVYENIEIIEPKYESILYSYNKENLFAFLNDKIIQYKISTTKEISLDFNNLESSIKWCESDKKAKNIFKKLKSSYMKEALNLIFKDKNEIDMAQKNYPNVNFLEPKSIFDAVNKILAEFENDINITLILYKAYKYHFDSKSDDVSDLKWGIINFYIAEIYYKKQNYSLAIDYAQIAKTFVPIRNSFYITLLQFICYNYFFSSLYKKSIDEGLIGLKWINEQQNHYKNSDALEWANNIKNELEMIKNTQETISYYLGCSYFNLENPNYTEALKYIELSLENKTDWNVFNKSYVKAVSTYNLNKDLQEAISVLQEADKVAEELKENLDDHCYIKYLLAFSYYYNFKNSQKALEKIKESLSINPYYKNSLELKEEINRRK
jgi:hypothetical protein